MRKSRWQKRKRVSMHVLLLHKYYYVMVKRISATTVFVSEKRDFKKAH